MSVNVQAPNKWWQGNFIRHADKIVHGVMRLGEFLVGDAPIASDREHHAIPSFHQSVSTSKPAVAPFGNPTKEDKTRKKDYAPTGGHAQLGGAAQAEVGPMINLQQVNGFEIFLKFQSGKCVAVDANGAAGPHSCSKATNRIHECGVCGNIGHGANECRHGSNKRQKGGKGKGGKGKGGRGKGKQ